MLRILSFLLLISLTINGHSQSVMFTAQETANMYHVVQKSPVLKRNLNEFFQYTGDTIYFKYDIEGRKDSLIDFDSIGQCIVYEPSKLKIDYYGLKTAPKGLLTELASKMALYQLYKELKSRKQELPEGFSDKAYQYFLDTLTLKLPNEVTRRKNGIDVPSGQIIDLIDPNYFFNQRVTALMGIQSINQVQQKTVILATNYATRSYLQNKAKEYYSKMCSDAPNFRTNMIACGDGSNSFGLLDEREKIYKHKNELGDPVGLGLFTYEPRFVSAGGNRQNLVPEQSTLKEFDALENEYTNLHFSMWGFNSNTQTTVAVYREGDMYLLYANKLTKELSPDTTFGKGTTLQSLIKNLEGYAIPKVNDELNGKDGIRERLESKDTNYHYVLMEIVETEMELSNLRYNGLKNKKKTKKAQDHLAWLYSRKVTIEQQQKELQEHLRDAEERLARLQARLFELKGYINYNELKYTHFGYIYTFEDGTTFNANTQDLVFPDSLKTDQIEVRLITFGTDALSQHVDEIQLLTSVSKGAPQDLDFHPYFLTFSDLFKPDEFKLKEIKLTQKEHFELSKMLNLILIDKLTFDFQLKGFGVGVLMDGKVVDCKDVEEDEYPGETKEEKELARKSEAYQPLRMSYLRFVRNGNLLTLDVESFTDPVKSNLAYKVSGVRELKKTLIGITENQILSAFRTFHITEQFCRLMMYSAHNDFEGKDEAKIMGEIKSALYKSKAFLQEGTYIKYAEYASIAHPDTDYFEMVVKELEDKDKEIQAKLGYEKEKK